GEVLVARPDEVGDATLGPRLGRLHQVRADLPRGDRSNRGTRDYGERAGCARQQLTGELMELRGTRDRERNVAGADGPLLRQLAGVVRRVDVVDADDRQGDMMSDSRALFCCEQVACAVLE